MQAFYTNSFLMNSMNFILLLFFLLWFFHYFLVYKNNLSKKAWKKVDYYWLGVATIGLISLAADVRINVAKNFISSERAQANATLGAVKIITDNPENSHFCMTLIRTSNSPSDYDNTELQYQLGCKWLKETSEYFKNVQKNELPDISFGDLPPVTFDSVVLNEDVASIMRWLYEYQIQLDVLNETQEAAEPSGFESILFYFAPFLVCIALALRITKVTGEIRHET